MTSYTITITPDDNSATTTTLRLDTSGGDVALTDLHLHAGNILSQGSVPAIDYGLLLQAITPSTPTPVLTAPAPQHEIDAAPSTVVDTTVTDAPAGPAKATSAPAKATAKSASGATKSATRSATKSAARSTKSTSKAAQPAAKASQPPAKAAEAPAKAAKSTAKATRSATRRAPGKKATAAETAPTAPATKARTRRSASSTRSGAQSSAADAAMAKKSAKAAPAKKATTRSTAAAASNERAYRRMPDDFATVYAQAGSAAAVADHYSVPRHTAHGWIRRLRGQDAAATR